MARPRKAILTLQEKLRMLKQAGLNPPEAEEGQAIDPVDHAGEEVPSLNARIKSILKLIKDKPMKPNELLYLVMYDIENDKVRTLIAEYLLQKGCIRIQKSVYLARTKPRVFQEINKTLKEVQEAYENNDSIILVPVHSQAAGNMRIIGKDIQIEALIDAPNTLFF